MAKYSKRKSRHRSRRKGRGGSVFDSLNEAGVKTFEAVKGFGSNVTDAAGDFTTKITGSVNSATHKVEDMGHSVASSTGISSGGSGKCCFPAKFCGSRSVRETSAVL